ncbi:MAG TPA: rod shape-determining protein MreD [Terriglobales bacterium]|nr:rod shape-determining protein MreD [Terriglobales bacterium]
MATITFTSREEIEVHRFSVAATVGIPLAAFFFQIYVSSHFSFLKLLDLPLLVTIFFAVSRRNQLAGMLTGCAIGLTQDALTHLPIGIYGICKTIIGYGASSIGLKVDVDNPGSRFLMVFFFTFLHDGLYFIVRRHLLGIPSDWRTLHEASAALANALIAVLLFALLDRTKKR